MSEHGHNNSDLNIAICDTGLGRLARLRGFWDEGTRLLDGAILRLQELLERGGSVDVQKVRGELAVAQFLLGEIRLLRFMELGREEDRSEARTLFVESRRLDKLLGSDSTDTEDRIRRVEVMGEAVT